MEKLGSDLLPENVADTAPLGTIQQPQPATTHALHKASARKCPPFDYARVQEPEWWSTRTEEHEHAKKRERENFSCLSRFIDNKAGTMWREEQGRFSNRDFSSTEKSYRPRSLVDFTTVKDKSSLKKYTRQ